MARVSALEDYRSDLRRVAITLAVVAAHVALIIVTLRSAGHSADVVDITFFALPINPEDRPREPVHVQKPPISRAAQTAPRHASVARESASEQRMEPSLEQPSKNETETLGDTIAARTNPASEPAPPIDWHAEVETSARALQQRDTIESGRRSLAGPNQPALSAPLKNPTCPYERCERGWGENLGVFKPSLHSKAGRVETMPRDGPTLPNGSQDMAGAEAVLWTNNWCYTVLVSPDPSRRGAHKCFFPVWKTAATRGDLFDHMDPSRPPKTHYNDAPWITYGFSISASHTDPRADR